MQVGGNGNCGIDNFQYLATVAFPDDGKYSFGDDKQINLPEVMLISCLIRKFLGKLLNS